MRVFRSSYKSRDGEMKKTTKWYVETRDHLQMVRRFIGFVDKRHPRRSLEVDEARALLRAAQQGPTIMGIAGPVVTVSGAAKSHGHR